MRAAVRTSRVWAWGAVAALTVGMVGIAVPANAAPPGSGQPVATATAEEPVDDSVTIDYYVNRAAKQIGQQVCTLDDVATDCGTQESASKKETSYSRTLTGLEDGEHVFRVTFTLTDGGIASATAEFTIEGALALACESLGGTLGYGPGSVVWTCYAFPWEGIQPGTGESAEDLAFSIWTSGWSLLGPYCLGGFHGGGFGTTEPNLIYDVWWQCSD